MKKSLELLAALDLSALQAFADAHEHGNRNGQLYVRYLDGVLPFLNQLDKDGQEIGSQYRAGEQQVMMWIKELLQFIQQKDTPMLENLEEKLMLILDILPDAYNGSCNYLVTSLVNAHETAMIRKCHHEDFQADLFGATHDSNMPDFVIQLSIMDAYYPVTDREATLQPLRDFFNDPVNIKQKQKALAMVQAIEVAIPATLSTDPLTIGYYSDLQKGATLLREVLSSPTSAELAQPPDDALLAKARGAIEMYLPRKLVVIPTTVVAFDDELATIEHALASKGLIDHRTLRRILANIQRKLELDANELAQLLKDSQDSNYIKFEGDNRIPYLLRVVREELNKNAIAHNTYNHALSTLLEHTLHFNIRYETVEIEYTLAKRLTYALRQYRDLNPKGYQGLRHQEVGQIQAIIHKLSAGHINDAAAIVLIKNIFKANTFEPGFLGSRLETLVMRSIKAYEASSDAMSNLRTLYVKRWLPAEPSHPRKVVLAMHGLGDNVHTFNAQAKAWAKAGYEVISYDQAGHGVDELRQQGKKLSLTQMQLDFYAMVDRCQQDESIGEIKLAGHGFGGVLVAHALPSITDIREAEVAQNHTPPQAHPHDAIPSAASAPGMDAPATDTALPQPIPSSLTAPRTAPSFAPIQPQQPKIKEVELFAPTLKQDTPWSKLKNIPRLLWNGADISAEEKDRRARTEIERPGSNRLFGAVNALLAFMGESYQILRSVFAYKSNNHVAPLTIEIHQGEDDTLVNAKHARALNAHAEKANSENSPSMVNLSVLFHPKAGHELHRDPAALTRILTSS